MSVGSEWTIAGALLLPSARIIIIALVINWPTNCSCLTLVNYYWHICSFSGSANLIDALLLQLGIDSGLQLWCLADEAVTAAIDSNSIEWASADDECRLRLCSLMCLCISRVFDNSFFHE